MKNILLVIISVIAVSGCATQQELDQRRSVLLAAHARLDAAREQTTFKCTEKTICDKAFRLTKIYIQQNSDMKLQFSDDTTVSTYNSIDYGLIAMQATRIPGDGTSESITIVASCKGMDGFFFEECANRISTAYEGFSPYISNHLK